MWPSLILPLLCLFSVMNAANNYTGCVATEIATDFTLNPGDTIYSEDMNVRLIMQSDGNFCLYTFSGSIWIVRFCTYILVTGDYGVIDVDGNLRIYDSNDQELWEAINETLPLSPVAPIRLCVDNCGEAFLYDVEGEELWETLYTNNAGIGGYPVNGCIDAAAPTQSPTTAQPTTAVPTSTPAPSYSGCVETGVDTDFTFMAGKSIYSEDGNVRFIMQSDGNLCLYTRNDATSMWIDRFCSYVLGSGQYAIVKRIGNVVVVDKDGNEVWKAVNVTLPLQPTEPVTLCVSDCGYVFLFDDGGDKLWESKYNTNPTLPNYPNDCGNVTAPTSMPTAMPTEMADAVNTFKPWVACWMIMIVVFCNF